MTLMKWASSVLQWQLQKEAITKVGANPQKLSFPNCSLQLENMKLESLVIVDQHATVKLYLGFVLPARHTLKIEWIQSFFEKLE